MPLTDDQKLEIAKQFVTAPTKWRPDKDDPIYESFLCAFSKSAQCSIRFKFSDKRGATPGLSVVLDGTGKIPNQKFLNHFTKFFNGGEFTISKKDSENIENSNSRSARMTFIRNNCKAEQKCTDLDTAYRQIFDPGTDVDVWRSFFSSLVNEVQGFTSVAPVYKGTLVPLGSGRNTQSPGQVESQSGNQKGANEDELLSRNLIYFGAPGTGKSFKLNKNVEAKFAGHYERVTFYPTYSYAQFVGCYKPVMEKPAVGGKEEIAYRFVPGPFLRALVNALKEFCFPKFMAVSELEKKTVEELRAYVKELKKDDPEAKLELRVSKAKEYNGKQGRPWKNTDEFIEMLEEYYKNKYQKHCLVIEEINRANAAAVFGDVFQLLDRKDNGESEYDVAASEDIKRYLKKELDEVKYKCAREFLGAESNGTIELDDKGEWKNCRLRIPSNMYIWATMNSADQGVFPLDTAFKRRWEFEYIDIDNGADKSSDGTPSPDKWTIVGANHSYNWDEVRRYINDLLSENGVNEDKLMGARFVTGVKNGENVIVSQNTFKSKVLMYLWEDAARMCRQKIFADGIKTLKKLCEEWDAKGLGVFKRYKKDGKDDVPLPTDLKGKDGEGLGE